jgi:hypothetical protein
MLVAGERQHGTPHLGAIPKNDAFHVLSDQAQYGLRIVHNDPQDPSCPQRDRA